MPKSIADLFAARTPTLPRPARLSLEGLETREVYSVNPLIALENGTVRVTGTEGDDRISIGYYGGFGGFVERDRLEVTVTDPGGKVKSVDTTVLPGRLWLKNVIFDGKDGNDYFAFGRDPFSGVVDVVAYGGKGNDTIIAADGDDRLWGGEGDDKVYGLDGNDGLYGEAGDDLVSDRYQPNQGLYSEVDMDPGGGWNNLSGGSGTDLVVGGIGSDYLNGGQDGKWDRLSGCGGQDTFVTEFAKLNPYAIAINIDIPQDYDADDRTVPPDEIHWVAR